MVTQGQTDAQHMFLRQRLQALDTGWNELHKMWENRQNLLSQSHAYQLFLRDTKFGAPWFRCLLRSSPQLNLWINEKMLTAQDMTYDEARNLHSKWLKHQAFMAELQSNKEWLDKISKVRRAKREGGGALRVPPTIVTRDLASLKTMWEELESTTQTKAKCLFDANKAELFTQSCADLDNIYQITNNKRLGEVGEVYVK
uniref:Uncharacterized protein n=1 Tax=Oryzias melastigma TaxID=30732 RepID=A0A3B3CX45_ORYME